MLKKCYIGVYAVALLGVVRFTTRIEAAVSRECDLEKRSFLCRVLFACEVSVNTNFG